ncbi:MAG: T9SS type A sorting domain-containing protein, partial [Ignavibacteria bacterium]|nr:T9SS type A sorting domain-containing protein [Ignavibacteria bacterium]
MLYKWFTPNSFYGIQFIGGKGYAVNRYSDVYKNEDGTGNSWSYKSSAGLWETFAFRFVDANTGYLLKENRHIQKTTDGGSTWFTVLSPVAFNSRNKVGGITFTNPNVGYAWMSLNDYGEYHVFKTSNAGNNWAEILTIAGPGYISGDIGFFDNETGFIAGPKRWMIRTSNGGATWDSAKFNLFPSYLSSKDFEDVFVLDNSRAWAVGVGFICYTYDKGVNWYYLDHGIKGIDSSFYNIAFYQDTLGYIGCYDGTILKTTNGGSNWIVDTTYKNLYYLYSSGFNETGRIFFGTSNGRIIAGEQIVKVEGEINNLPKQFLLEQNFPNPFNSKTVIKFQLMSNSHTILKIYDMLGRELKTLIDKQLPEGIHTIELDASNLSSGIYFYKLRTDTYSAQRKMVIVK